VSIVVTVFAPSVAAGGTVVLLRSNLLATDNNTPKATDAQLLFTVTLPPSHGSLHLSGSPASQFTQQDINDGLVTYTNSGGTADSFGMFVRVTATPGVAKPYSPTFTNFSAPMPASDGGVYLATALVGSTVPPVFNVLGGIQGGSGTGTTHSATFTVHANTVLVLAAWSSPIAGGTTGGPVTVTSISATGLTLTHIGGGQITTSLSGPGYSSVWNTVDWYWAPVSATATVTVNVTFSASFAHSLMMIGFHEFSGVASIAAPWDTNAGNLASTVTGSLPATVSLMADAPDNLVLPVFFEMVSGDEIGGMAYSFPVGYQALGQSGGTIGVLGAYSRFSAAASMPIVISDTPPPEPPSVFLSLDDVVVRTIPTPPCQIFLKYSDDRGHSFGSPVGQPLGSLGEYLTTVTWNRLGYARDRVFSLEWSCPRPTALQGAFVVANTAAKS